MCFCTCSYLQWDKSPTSSWYHNLSLLHTTTDYLSGHLWYIQRTIYSETWTGIDKELQRHSRLGWKSLKRHSMKGFNGVFFFFFAWQLGSIVYFPAQSKLNGCSGRSPSPPPVWLLTSGDRQEYFSGHILSLQSPPPAHLWVWSNQCAPRQTLLSFVLATIIYPFDSCCRTLTFVTFLSKFHG